MLIATRGRSTVLRRFTGPLAEEVAVLSRPSDGSLSTLQQARGVYATLSDTLAALEAGSRHLAGETLFLRDIRRDLPQVLEARRQVLESVGRSDAAPLPAFIEQAPIDERVAFESMASLVIPRGKPAWSVSDAPVAPACGCAGCARSGVRLVRLGEQISLHSSNVYGSGASVHEQAREMFRVAAGLLAQHGMEFSDVTRTWIQLRDIDRDYDALNAARREFFTDCGLSLRPASTGVGGAAFPLEHACALSLQAIKSSRRVEKVGMSTPSLNEAWSYGADFSRGLRVVEENRVALHVSGTASIDGAGRSVHSGSFAAQAERMLDNIESLLGRQEAGFPDLLSAVTYLKRPEDAPALRTLFERRGIADLPCAIVRADLCRPELLCETEALAVLPREPTEA